MGAEEKVSFTGYEWQAGEGYYPTLADVEEELRCAREGKPYTWPVPRRPGSEPKEQEMGAVAWATAKYAICSGAVRLEDVAKSHFGLTEVALKNIFYGERWPTLAKIKRWKKRGFVVGHENHNDESFSTGEENSDNTQPLEARSIEQLVSEHREAHSEQRLAQKMVGMTVTEWMSSLEDSKAAYRKMAAQLAIERIHNHSLAPIRTYKDLDIADRVARRNLGLEAEERGGGSNGGATINIGLLGMDPSIIKTVSPSPLHEAEVTEDTSP